MTLTYAQIQTQIDKLKDEEQALKKLRETIDEDIRLRIIPRDMGDQWKQGILKALEDIPVKRSILQFNAGEAVTFLPEPCGTLRADPEQRRASMIEHGVSEAMADADYEVWMRRMRNR